MVRAAGQPIAVYSHHGNGLVVYFKEAAGVNGAALIFGDGKDGTGDHLPQSALGDGNAISTFHIGKLGVIFRIGGGDIEVGEAGADGHFVVVVHADADWSFRQTADDVEQQPGR